MSKPLKWILFLLVVLPFLVGFFRACFIFFVPHFKLGHYRQLARLAYRNRLDIMRLRPRARTASTLFAPASSNLRADKSGRVE